MRAVQDHSTDAQTVVLVAGTRPELIKVAPLVPAVEARGMVPRLVLTGQHTDVLEPLVEHFQLPVHARLHRSISDRTSLNRLLSGLVADLHSILDERADAVVVQGDTTSALAGALAAFHLQRPLVHVEAGLRTGDLASPFPEEGNRRLIGQIASLHLAPTEGARRALLAEGVASESILVTGNTVIDALCYTVDRLPPSVQETARTLLVTAHRRESWGEAFDRVMSAVAACARRHPDLRVRWVAHPNPQLRARVDKALGGVQNVDILDPLPYVSMVEELQRATVVLTDSGGLQEEAPSLGKPVLVMRETTERPEAVEAGCARLVGTDPVAIEEAVSTLLQSSAAYTRMASPTNPYGDGRAALRSSRAIQALLGEDDARSIPAPRKPAVTGAREEDPVRR